ncbi:MAG: NAD(P)/FAD-dependent oxidoreductase [Pseudomonadota bacterium]
MDQSDLDAIIIGAGHNSLACALHLAAKGWKVAVFEQASEPGGAVKTGEYTEAGFRHDWAAMNLSLFAGSNFFKAYGEELGKNGVEFAPASDCFASVFPDGKWLGISNHFDTNKARIAEFSEKDSEAWARLTDEFPAEAEHLFGVLGSPMSLRAFASTGWKVFRRKGTAGALDLIRFMMASPRHWLEETFESHHVRATLGAWGMHLDFAPDVAGGALFPYLEAMANQSFGMALGKNGSDTIIRAMVEALEARGGSVTCHAPVVRVLHEGGRATGIELKDKRTIKANKVVIANVSPGALLELTGGSHDDDHNTAMERFTHAPGTMMIHLAMDDLPDWQAGPELRNFAYVHLAPSLDQMTLAYHQARAGLLPEEPVVVVGQPTTVDPSRAPEGKHVLWLQARMAPDEIRGDSAGAISATDWQTAAEPFAERVLDILERYAPGLRKKIRARRIVSPLELEADNPNLVGGDQICGSHHLAQHFFFRPSRGTSDGSTPIKNLHLTGAAVWPGAGTGAGSGFLLGQKLAGV